MTDSQSLEKQGREIHAVTKSLEIIDGLRELDGAGVTELANHLGFSKGTVHNHLSTLWNGQFVTKHGDEYRLSLRFLEYGQYMKNKIEWLDVVENELDHLALDTGEVANFMIEEHGMGVFLYKKRGEQGVHTLSYVGDRKPLHHTSMGKAILANLPTEHVEEIISRHGLPAANENTITDRSALIEELATIRERGIAFDDEEILSGVRCAATPIQTNDVLYGAISLSGPVSRMRGDRFREEIPRKLEDTANVIEVNIRSL